MNKFTSVLAGIVSLVALNQTAQAEISGQLQLTGFAGGNCSLTVSASPAASNLNLDQTPFQVPVGTVSKSCDFPHQLTVSTDSASQGITRMMHSNGIDSSDIMIFVDGFNMNFAGSNIPEVVPNGDFINSMPVTLDVNTFPTNSGVYTNTLTFSIVVD